MNYLFLKIYYVQTHTQLYTAELMYLQFQFKVSVTLVFCELKILNKQFEKYIIYKLQIPSILSNVLKTFPSSHDQNLIHLALLTLLNPR